MLGRLSRLASRYALLAGLLLLLGAALLYPIALTVRGAFYADPAAGTGFTLRNLVQVLRDPVLVSGLGNSLRIAAGTTLVATLIALPLAVLSVRYRFPGKAVFNALVLVPLILPPFVGAIGVRAILGRAGALNALLGTDIDFLAGATMPGPLGWLADGRLIAVILMQSLALYPIVYLNASAALANIDPALEEAAENLGAGPWRRLRRVTLPLIRPGLFAGGTIVFVWAFTELGTPLMFDFYRVTPVQIFNGLKEVENSAQPYALTFIMLSMAVGIYAAGRVAFGAAPSSSPTRGWRASAEKPLTGWRGLLACGAFGLVAALALLPHLGVVLTSVCVPGAWYRSVLPRAFTLGHYEQALTAADSFGSIVNSLKYSTMAMGVDLLLGILIGYVIVRTRLRGRDLLDAMCMLPLAVPGLVLAFGFVAMSLRWPFASGPLGGLASVLGAEPNPIPLLVIAYAVRRLPYIVRATVAGLQQTSGELEEAAINLGASRFTAARRVIVPLILPNLIAGALLVFSFSMLEVSDSLILAQQTRHYPVTKAIFAFTERLGDGAYIASALGVWGMALLATTLAGASILLGRKLGAMFRV